MRFGEACEAAVGQGRIEDDVIRSLGLSLLVLQASLSLQSSQSVFHDADLAGIDRGFGELRDGMNAKGFEFGALVTTKIGD